MPGWQGYLCSPNASTTPLKYSRFRDCSVLVFLLGAAASLKPRVSDLVSCLIVRYYLVKRHPGLCTLFAVAEKYGMLFMYYTLMRLFDEEKETGRNLKWIKVYRVKGKKILLKTI